MKKYYVKETGKELILGNSYNSITLLPGPISVKLSSNKLDLNTLNRLIDLGYVMCKDEKPHFTPIKFEDIPKESSFYIGKLLSKIDLVSLEEMDTVFPGIVYSMLLKEIAIELDKQYPSHIKKCKELFKINMERNSIEGVNNNAEVPLFYKNTPLFRSIKDAQFARKILEGWNENVFTEDK